MKNETLEFTVPTGPLRFKLTNDYMFKAFLQRNEKALRGLICALLRIESRQIRSIEITNPIELGSTIIDKFIILDIKLILNCQQIINIEMQVDNLGDWPERSLTYLCRTFDNLRAGENYSQTLKVIHVGILDFTPKDFPENLFMKYNFINLDTGHIYSDKLTILMLQLNQLGKPKDEAEMPDLYYWAQLFRATTWEEINMLAEKNESIKEGIVTLRELSEDDKIRMQCEAREKYRRDLASATSYGEELGMERGLQQGMEKGLQQGMEKGLQQGMEKGLQQGMEKGLQQGLALTKLLIQEGKLDDLAKASEDRFYREELIKKYNL